MSYNILPTKQFSVDFNKIFKIMEDNRFMVQEMVKLAQEITMKEAPEDALSIVLRTYREFEKEQKPLR